MEKTALGPAPATTRRRTPLSRARAAVLRAVEDAADEGLAPTLAQLADRTGSHPNTLREHLDALVRDGAVRRQSAAPSGRGRPAWRYAIVPDGVAEYAGLAATLASVIHRSSADPVRDAVAAGTEWGHDLAAAPDPHPSSDARDRVVALFSGMGFAPRVDTATDERLTVRLTRCPLLEAAHRHPDVVCGVHLGIAEGALEEYGATDSSARLLPFAEPGACLLHLDGPVVAP